MECIRKDLFLVLLIATGVYGLTSQWFSINGGSVTSYPLSQQAPLVTASSNCTNVDCYIVYTGTFQVNSIVINTNQLNVYSSPMSYIVGQSDFAFWNSIFLPSGISVMVVTGQAPGQLFQSTFTRNPTLGDSVSLTCGYYIDVMASFTNGPLSVVYLRTASNSVYLYMPNTGFCSIISNTDANIAPGVIRVVGEYNPGNLQTKSYLLYSLNAKLYWKSVYDVVSTNPPTLLATTPTGIYDVRSHRQNGYTILFISTVGSGILQYNTTAGGSPSLFVDYSLLRSGDFATSLILGSDSNNQDIVIFTTNSGDVYYTDIRTKQTTRILDGGNTGGILPRYFLFNWEVKDDNYARPCLLLSNGPQQTLSIYYFDTNSWEVIGSKANWKFGVESQSFVSSILFNPVGAPGSRKINLFAFTSLNEALQLKPVNSSKFNFLVQSPPINNERFTIRNGLQQVSDVFAMRNVTEKIPPSFNRVFAEIANNNTVIANLSTTQPNMPNYVIAIVGIDIPSERNREDIASIQYFNISSYYNTGFPPDTQLRYLSYDNLFKYIYNPSIIYTWTWTNFTRRF